MQLRFTLLTVTSLQRDLHPQVCAHAGRTKKNGLQQNCCNPLISLAEWTGLEPATPGVTGRYSNRLNYHSASVWLLPIACAKSQVPQNLATLRGFEPRYSP